MLGLSDLLCFAGAEQLGDSICGQALFHRLGCLDLAASAHPDVDQAACPSLCGLLCSSIHVVSTGVAACGMTHAQSSVSR